MQTPQDVVKVPDMPRKTRHTGLTELTSRTGIQTA